jgi:hypothetical protein
MRRFEGLLSAGVSLYKFAGKTRHNPAISVLGLFQGGYMAVSSGLAGQYMAVGSGLTAFSSCGYPIGKVNHIAIDLLFFAIKNLWQGLNKICKVKSK